MEKNLSDVTENPDRDEASFLARFNAITQGLDENLDLEACLEQLATLVAESLDTSRCSLMLTTSDTQTDILKLKVCAHFGDLPKAAYNELVDLKEGISGQVMVSGKPLLVTDIGDSPFKNLVRFSSGDRNDGFIICPLVVSGTIMGVVNISRPNDYRVFTSEDLKTAMIIALLISQCIQIYQLKNLFRSNFVKLAIAKEAQGKSTQTLNQMVSSNDKTIKVLAKSFYSELKKAGFNRELIIGSATEIISLVTTELNETKKSL